MTKKFYTILNIIIIAGIIYAGVDSFYLFVEEKFDQPDFNIRFSEAKQNTTALPSQKLSDYRIIQNRNIFGETPQKSEIHEEIPELDNLEPTSLKIILMGTIFGDSRNAAAIIQDNIKKSQDLYRIGDSIQNAIIKNILRGKIVLSYNGRDEILVMDEPDSRGNTVTPPGVSTATQARTGSPPQRTITLKRDDIIESFENLNELATISPHLTDGRTDGLSIAGIRTGSIFRKIGLRNGDIIKRIDGNEITGTGDFVTLYNNFKSVDTISVDIIRRGQEYTYNYRLR
ncbi:type II secretion system protein N [Thermodesulfobacteriota bacterium]